MSAKMPVLITITVSDGDYDLRKVQMVVSEEFEQPLIEAAIGLARCARDVDPVSGAAPEGWSRKLTDEERAELVVLGVWP